MMFVAPMMQLIILPLVANFDVKNINLVYVDHDQSPYSHQLIQKITSSGYFRLVDAPFSYKEGLSLIEDGKADVVLEVPDGFERNLVREGRQALGVSIDAINGSKSSLGGAYLLSVIREFNTDLDVNIKAPQRIGAVAKLNVATTHWYNPHLQYTRYIVPGILAILLTIIGGFLSALNVVREKEIGTIEQINVTPIKKWQFILGKLIPFYFGTYSDVCSIWYLPSRQFAYPICFCRHVSHCDSGFWAFGLHLCRFAITSHVHCLLLYHDFPSDEWFLNKCR